MIRRFGRESILALASGALAALSLPGFGASGLVYGALVPLFLALGRARTVRQGALLSFLFGLSFFAIDVRWIASLSRFNPLVVPGYVLLAAYLALPFAVVGALLVWLRDRRSSWMWLVAAPALLVLAEFARTLGPFGTGFSMLHHALYRVPWLLASAAMLGSWAISGFIVAVNAALYRALRTRRLFPLACAVLLVGVQAAFTLVPIGVNRDAPDLDVALLSSDVDQRVKLDARNLATLTDRYIALAEEALTHEPDLIVFPESFLPAYILNRDDLFPRLAAVAQEGACQLLFGTGEYRERSILNSTVLVDPAGTVVSTYSMVRPVPFGEYIPGRAILERLGLGAWTRSLLPLDLTRGSAYQPLGEYGTPICFESVFPTAARAFVRSGAKLLVTVTNDAWFDGSSELRAHFAAAVFRSVENRRWTVQVANGGVSGVVDASGRIRSEFIGEGVIVARDVDRLSGMSLYARWGDAPLLAGMGFVAFVALAFGAITRRKKRGE